MRNLKEAPNSTKGPSEKPLGEKTFYEWQVVPPLGESQKGVGSNNGKKDQFLANLPPEVFLT